jgi:hypothetical protein
VIALQRLDPGRITAANVESYLIIYPYDNVLYFNRFCKTLNIPIPARSRYCRFTRQRVARYDHYCPWALAVIGAKTHRIFICWLALNTFGACYFGIHQVWVFREFVRILGQKMRSASGGAKLIGVAFVLIRSEPAATFSTVLLIGAGAILSFFFCQQIWLISKNKTRIELQKIDELVWSWRKGGKSVQQYGHAYDRGFVANWREFLFPPAAKRHKARDYSAEIAEWHLQHPDEKRTKSEKAD